LQDAENALKALRAARDKASEKRALEALQKAFQKLKDAADQVPPR